MYLTENELNHKPTENMEIPRSYQIASTAQEALKNYSWLGKFSLDYS